MVTDKQTDRQTYAGDSTIPRESYRGDNKLQYKNCLFAPACKGVHEVRMRQTGSPGVRSTARQSLVVERRYHPPSASHRASYK